MFLKFIRNLIEGFDFLLKIGIVHLSALLLILDYGLGWPAPGFSAKPLKKVLSSKSEVECEIDGVKLYEKRDSIDVSYWYIFLNGKRNLFYVYHLLYSSDENDKNVLLTYKFPVSVYGGRDQDVAYTNFLIEENDSLITINYNKEPADGFVIENNPFNKKIVMKYNQELINSNTLLKRVDGKTVINKIEEACF